MAGMNSVRGRLLTAGAITSATVALVVAALVHNGAGQADANAQALSSPASQSPTAAATQPAQNAVSGSVQEPSSQNFQAPPSNSGQIYVYPSGSGAVLVFPDGRQVYVPNAESLRRERDGAGFENGF